MQYVLIPAGFMLVFMSACSSPERSGCCDVVKYQNTSKTHHGGKARELISLADSLAPLRDRFNAEQGKPRLVALLSPT